MRKRSAKGRMVSVIAALSLVVPSLAFAQGSRGTLGCPLFYATRLKGAEITYTNISLRNLGGKGTVAIERIDLYHTDGTLAATLGPGKFPPAFRASLGPHQSTSLRLPDVVKAPPTDPWLQAAIAWKADVPIVSFLATSIFLTFGRDPKTGAEKELRARHVYPCHPIEEGR